MAVAATPVSWLMLALGCLVGGALSVRASAAPGFVTQAVHVSVPGAAPNLTTTTLPEAGGKENDGFLTVVDNAGMGFRALPPYGGTPCMKRTKTSVTAEHSGCRYAVNGGPFDMETGACTGVLISKGKTLVDQFSTGAPLFGRTSDNRWVVGVLNASLARQLAVTDAVSGFGWLVRNFNSTVSNPGGEVAPRTAVGTDAEGRLLLLTVDGCEKCQQGDQGLTLYGLAQLLVKHGARFAINLDGGGSTVAVRNKTIIDKPTCSDAPFPKCERAVTTVVCVV